MCLRFEDAVSILRFPRSADEVSLVAIMYFQKDVLFTLTLLRPVLKLISTEEMTPVNLLTVLQAYAASYWHNSAAVLT